MSFQPSPPNSLLQAAEEGSRSRRSRLAQIPGYAIECEIGRGGMATVYLAVQQSLNRQVALKVLTQATEEEDDDFAQRFKKEGHILAQLLHPNIVTIHDIGITEDGDLFLSIEYLSGGTLRDKIKQGLSFDAAIEITRSIAKALDYAHKQGIIHRDIKPSNIMFRHDGTPVLTDFGIARVIGSKTIHTSAGFSIGSPGYMSPEQAMGESITIESDIYALGVVLYEMLTGHPLYESSHALAITLKHLQDPIPELPNQYAYLQPIINKLLAKKSSDRYKNISEFLEALNIILPSDATSQSKPNIDISNVSIAEFASGKVRTFLNKKSRLPVIISSVAILLVAVFYIYKSQNFFNPVQTSEPDSVTEQTARDEMQRQQQLQAEYLFTQAQISFQEGAFNVSLAHIEQGLLAAPDHPGLLSLREQVKTRKAELDQQAEQAKRQQEEEAARQQAEQAKRQQEEEAARQQAEQVKRQQEEEARQQAKTVEPTRRPAEPASRQTPAVAKPNPAKPVRSPTIPEEKRKPTIAETGASKVKQSSRCENILSRITLGEAVSSADQIFMTKECR